MECTVHYSETAELFLFLRQVFSMERFQPFNPLMSSAESKLPDSRREVLFFLGILTNGYLSALQYLIDNPRAELADILADPSCLFAREGETINDERVLENIDSFRAEYFGNSRWGAECRSLLRDLWLHVICRDKADNPGIILDRIMELKKETSSVDPLVFLSGLSDRFELEGDAVRFRIKPELAMSRKEIEEITIAPSLYATRTLTFWYSGKRLLFFVSLEKKSSGIPEPGDMNLLYTTALNDRTRLKMLRFIAARNCTASELAGFLSMNPSTVSRHLKIFKDAGFIDIHQGEGKTLSYSISRSGLERAFSELARYLLEEEN